MHTAIAVKRSASSVDSGSPESTLLAAKNDMSYSKLINGLSKAGVDLDRKVLADLAVFDPKGFSQVVKVARGALN